MPEASGFRQGPRWFCEKSLSPVFRPRSGLDHDLIDIAPATIFARLEAPNDRMGGLMKMPRRMFAGRIVATADVPAGETKPQVHPPTARLEAFFTAVGRTRLDGANLPEMRAFRHQCFS
jgi:hypothetical protein